MNCMPSTVGPDLSAALAAMVGAEHVPGGEAERRYFSTDLSCLPGALGLE